MTKEEIIQELIINKTASQKNLHIVSDFILDNFEISDFNAVNSLLKDLYDHKITDITVLYGTVRWCVGPYKRFKDKLSNLEQLSEWAKEQVIIQRAGNEKAIRQLHNGLKID